MLVWERERAAVRLMRRDVLVLAEAVRRGLKSNDGSGIEEVMFCNRVSISNGMK